LWGFVGIFWKVGPKWDQFFDRLDRSAKIALIANSVASEHFRTFPALDYHHDVLRDAGRDLRACRGTPPIMEVHVGASCSIAQAISPLREGIVVGDQWE